MDDVALLSKVATKKQLEYLAMILAVMLKSIWICVFTRNTSLGNYKSSLVNKLILPFAFFIECICSVAISVILVLGLFTSLMKVPKNI
jgi:hypothetical protein